MTNRLMHTLRMIGVVCVLATGASAQESLPTIKLPSELDRVLRDYEKAWMARDAAALTKLFSADGIVMQDNRGMYRGPVAIHEAYRGSGGSLALRPVAYSTADTLGYIIGAFSSKPGDPDGGKFILLLSRKRGGPWLIAADMDNGVPRR